MRPYALLISQLYWAILLEELALGFHGRKSDIQIDRAVKEQSYALSVFTHEGYVGLERVPGVVEAQLPALEYDLAVGGIKAHYAVGDAQLALSSQTADAHYLALMHLEAHVLNLFAGHVYAKVLNIEYYLIAYLAPALVAVEDKCAAYHQPRYFSGGDVLGILGSYQLAVAQYGDAVRKADYLLQTVAYEYDAYALRRQAADSGKKIRGLGLRKHCRRLVKYEIAYACLIDLTGYLNELHMSYGQAVNHRILLNFQFLQTLAKYL